MVIVLFSIRVKASRELCTMAFLLYFIRNSRENARLLTFSSRNRMQKGKLYTKCSVKIEFDTKSTSKGCFSLSTDRNFHFWRGSQHWNSSFRFHIVAVLWKPSVRVIFFAYFNIFSFTVTWIRKKVYANYPDDMRLPDQRIKVCRLFAEVI